MKSVIILIGVLIIAVMSLSAELVQVGSGGNTLSLIDSSETETILQYRISNYNKLKVEINGTDYYHIGLPKEGITQDKGYPELPVFNRSVIIPDNALMKLDIYDLEYQDIRLRVAPSKGVITRDIDPKTVPYTFGDVYDSQSFHPNSIAKLSEPYILRDFRGITIQTMPFAYNPSTQTLRIYTAYKIRVFAEGTDTVNVLSATRSSISSEFSPIYENHFVNWQNYRYTPVSDAFGKLLVICHTNYLTQIAPYVNWKKQKGISTELVEWSTIGTTAAQLQTYIQNRYNADNTITFVQLVGDAPQIPSLASGGGGSDPTFALVAGGDNYPDIFIGRFSAETTAQVTTQVNKAIVYERDLNTTATWLTQAMGIASSEGGGSLGDMGESDIAHMNLIRTDLLGYGYTTVDQIYDPGASATTVTTNVNAGRGFINYVGHGSDTSWVTTGFSSTNATALTNGNKTPFIMDVACVNGNFVSMTCFAEAWQRNANGGSVAIYASTINQSWNSPMRAQDEATDLLIAESKTTTGGLYYNASCKMMDIYGNTTGSDGVNMYKTWTIFGDAALMVRSKTPIAMTVNHPATITIGTTNVSVNTGVANAKVAITYNNTIYGVGTANGSGVATVTITNAPTGVVTYTVTATAFNRVTYVGSMQQVAGTGPYMTVETTTYADSNNNVAEYNEAGRFNVTFKNVGTALATNVAATLSCATAGITITDNSETIASLAAGASTTVNNAFAFSIANNVANGTSASFTITMVSGSETWTHNFSLVLNAPLLGFGSMTISDPAPGNNNGTLDSGETVTVTIPLNNTGGAASPSGSATLNSPTSGITINTASVNYAAIAAGGSANLSFSITAASGMGNGVLASLEFNAVAGAYNASKTETAEVGAPTVITIGSGTSTQTYPIDRYYNYSAHEAIYLASEIGIPGTIKSIAYYKASGTDVNAIEAVTIYMKNTTATTMASGTYSTTGYTQVYSGVFTNSNITGWMSVDLTNQFLYNGTNLSILVVKGNQAWISTYPNWTYTVASSTRARQARSDDAAPTSLTATTYLPNMQLKMFPAAGIMLPPQNVAATASHAVVNLSWSAPASGSPTGYKIFKNSSLLTTVTGLGYSDTAVTNGTTYSYYLKAAYSGGESDASETVTATPNAVAPTNLTASGANQLVSLAWTAATGREEVQEEGLSSQSTRAISGYRVYRNNTAITTVTGTSYQDTGLTNGVSYSYYVTTVYTNPTGESAPSNTATATPNVVTEAIIGSGTSATGISEGAPINIWYKSLHGQSVYTAAELNAAGIVGQTNITQLGFYVATAPTLALPSFTIRMKHTTESNVANWQTSANMVAVYTNTSYAPVAGGYHMLTLTNPFLWNGTDNIVVDTAFGLVATYSQTGTVRYTSVPSGYRYVRDDTVDQTSIFTGGTVTVYRPNIKLVFQPVQTDYANIAANPTSVSQTVNTGATANAQITISNSGNIPLVWSSTDREDELLSNGGLSTSFETQRTTWLSFSPSSGTVPAGGNVVISLTMDSAGLGNGTFNKNLVITSNATNNPSLSIPISFTVSDLVPNQPRFVAEWEPATGAIIRYPFGLPYNMIADMSNNGLLYVIVTSASQSTCNSALSSNGVNMTNVRYINATTDSYWTRDYGPWTIFDANNNMKIVDFTYNRPRPNDDVIPTTIANYLGIPAYQFNVSHTGGNIMTDGMGKAMSTQLVLEENPSLTQAQINSMFQTYLGVTEYQLYTDPNNTYIDHIDCWAKLLDVDKVMIRRVPTSHAQYSAIEAVVNTWSTKTSSYGTPYRIFRVYTPNDEPYSNAYFMNNKIYVPQMGTANDAAALASYQIAMPGYTIVGYSYANFESTDAIHCRVNTVFDSQMLSVKHIPPTSAQATQPVAMSVDISHINAINPANTYVTWKAGYSGAWQNAGLTYVSGRTWTASITAPALGDTIYYWIKATDTTARTTSLPLCKGSDPFKLIVDVPGPNLAPTINLPESLSFDKNGSLVHSFASYISDPNNDSLTLSVSGNTNIAVQIVGSQVTFGATDNWIGDELLTFTVSDGSLTASDDITIMVNPTNTPDWEPVDYGTTPAMLHAVVTIDNIPANVNDMIAAFVGSECRGIGQIVLIGRLSAHADFEVNLASNETVNFKIYSYLEDMVYPVQEVLPMEPGVVYGETEPVTLNGTTNLVLAIPVVDMVSTGSTARISWNAVPHADSYKVYASSEPFGGYSFVGSTSNLYWDITPSADRMFFQVVSVKDQRIK